MDGTLWQKRIDELADVVDGARIIRLRHARELRLATVNRSSECDFAGATCDGASNMRTGGWQCHVDLLLLGYLLRSTISPFISSIFASNSIWLR